jgi:hypothetical protein
MAQQTCHTVIFFGQNLFEMGGSAQLNFAPKTFGRNFSDLGENSPNQKILAGHWDEIRPNQNKIRPQIFGRNLTARIRPLSGEQELLCTLEKIPILHANTTY